jgi:nucleotide-binding universal stress UspA family protein
MINFSRILFPVDFSAQSRAAAPFVKAMAKCFGAEVAALHVIDIPPSFAAIVETERLKIEASAALNLLLAEELSGVRVTAELADGDAARSIVNYAQDRHVDLIMMPTHGHGPFRALLLGSVTAKVLHDARCPVWTGVHAEKMMGRSPDRWKRVLCTLDTEVDTDGHAGNVLQWALEFARGQNMELRVVHAVAGAGGMWSDQSDPSMYEFLFHAAREKLAGLQAKAGTNLEIFLLPGSVGSAVHKAALEFEADLIVIGRGAAQQAFGPLRSHAYSIIREAPCPVISTP